MLLSLVEWSYLNTHMCKFESSQKDESRAQSDDSSTKTYGKPRAFKLSTHTLATSHDLGKLSDQSFIGVRRCALKSHTDLLISAASGWSSIWGLPSTCNTRRRRTHTSRYPTWSKPCWTRTRTWRPGNLQTLRNDETCTNYRENSCKELLEMVPSWVFAPPHSESQRSDLHQNRVVKSVPWHSNKGCKIRLTVKLLNLGSRSNKLRFQFRFWRHFKTLRIRAVRCHHAVKGSASR